MGYLEEMREILRYDVACVAEYATPFYIGGSQGANVWLFLLRCHDNAGMKVILTCECKTGGYWGWYDPYRAETESMIVSDE